VKLVLISALFLVPTFAAAQSVTRWTPERIEAAKEAAAVRNMNADTGVVNRGAVDRRVHGEMGVEIGTGGYRSVFATAVMPLGQDAGMAFSFENTQADMRQYDRRR
jgi:hypothetical protein